MKSFEKNQENLKINRGFISKIIKNNVVNLSRILGILLLVLTASNCSKDDDDMASPVVLKTQTFVIQGTNNCNTSTGTGSTIFLYIPFTAPDGTAIKKLHRITRVSTGDSKEDVSTVFKNENNTIEWATCIRFGSLTWMEFEVRMEAADGTLSNASIVRINRPAGAN